MDISREHHYQQFHAAFKDYYGSLCSYAFSFVKDKDTSEDIVQEVFTRIWANRKDLIGTESLRFYLFTAVRNNCITHLRKEKTSGTIPWDERGSLHEQAEQVVPAKERDNNIDYDLLLAVAIGQLPPKCREIFILSRLSHMKYKEIAEALGISIKTVENQLSKALKIMRVFLREKGIYFLGALASFFS